MGFSDQRDGWKFLGQRVSRVWKQEQSQQQEDKLVWGKKKTEEKEGINLMSEKNCLKTVSFTVTETIVFFFLFSSALCSLL